MRIMQLLKVIGVTLEQTQKTERSLKYDITFRWISL